MPPRETGKKRASRIPLNYYKTPNRMERWKSKLALLALLVTAGAVGAAWVLRDGGKEFISRGPVAGVHAAWDNQCQACHADFKPMTKGNVASAFFGQSGSHDFASNLRCEQCHAGTDHNDKMKLDMTQSCGGCHRDHRGRDTSLVRLADADCTSCHANLKANVADGKQTDFESIASFATHPEFKPLKNDPGRLKFNHKLHMTPGQVDPPDAAGPMTLGRIADAATRKRYAEAPWQLNKADGEAVVLDCASCHRLDAGDWGITMKDKPASLAASALRPRAAGAYMQPINYELHCAACHPLTFDAKVKGKDGQLIAAPHGLQPAQVRDFIFGAYADKMGGEGIKQWLQDAMKSAANPERPLPGKRPQASVGDATAEAAEYVFNSNVDRADNFLKSGKTACGECHEYAVSGKTKTIEPVLVNDVWLPHAKFSHTAHRAFECRGCHKDAYTSEKSSAILIADVTSCRECHSPAGGVRSDCTECHRYHNGGHPLQGPGAAARDPAKKFSEVQKFLQGKQD